MIDIKGLDKAEVLAALYNRAMPQGFRRYKMKRMDVSEARQIVMERARRGVKLHFDYLLGRVMAVDIGGNFLDPALYDRDNGRGAAEEALGSLLTRPPCTCGTMSGAHRATCPQCPVDYR